MHLYSSYVLISVLFRKTQAFQQWLSLLIRLFYLSLNISFVHSFVRSFVRSSVHLFVRPFVHLFVRSFVHLFVRSFVRSFHCSFVRSFVRSPSSNLFTYLYTVSIGCLCLYFPSKAHISWSAYLVQTLIPHHLGFLIIQPCKYNPKQSHIITQLPIQKVIQQYHLTIQDHQYNSPIHQHCNTTQNCSFCPLRCDCCTLLLPQYV